MSRPSVAFPWQRALRSITARRHLALALITCGALAALPPSAAYAQDTTSPCTDTVAAAEEAYLNRNYQEAVTLASQCTDRSAFEDEIVIQAYRLITLASLRQGALVQARSAVTNILHIDPEYTADPVNDPPAYDLFISLVRQEEDTEGTADAETEIEEPSPAPPRRNEGGPFLKLIGVGLSDYTGDLPIGNAGHPFDFQEISTGSGAPYLFTAEIGYEFPSNLALVLGVQTGNYPIVGHSTGSNDISDSWRHTPQLLVRYTFGAAGESVAAYLDAGANVTFGGEGIAGPGVGPSVGGGIDIPLSSTWSFFVESRFNFTLPDNAIDGTSYPEDVQVERPPKGSITGPFDSVNQLLGIGLRIRFGGAAAQE
ncbi:hypothetical protein [Salinibacter ruber]|uniref:hypothetical protein n=1 Tax=Salinibacter ruber TaxID=146919 RepID=UPI001F084FF5|nr:hypothetical protein [Salinibacter ruber]